MGVSLKKGGNVSLTGSIPTLNSVKIGLGWEARETAGAEFDLDASLFMVESSGKVRNDHDFIFYGQLDSPCKSIHHTGDNRTGDGDGDDEELHVFLDKVPKPIERLVVAVTIHDADHRGHNFGQVRDAFIRIVDLDSDTEIARFDLSEDYSTETAMVFGEVYRRNDEWKFRAVGQGYSGGLDVLCGKYGVQVDG
jgi:tellurium resistance protein TerD